MSKRILSNSWPFLTALAAFVLWLLPTLASAQSIPASLGWYQIPNTNLRSVCAADHGFPQVAGNTGCAAITLAWSGGTFDTTRNRLIIWGGGHTDYEGNEIYALDLNNQTINRLTDPGLPTASSCSSSIAGGTQPNSRHTYGGQAYDPTTDKLLITAGSLACSSGTSASSPLADFWTYHFGTEAWSNLTVTNNGPGTPGDLTPNTNFNWNMAFDPVKQLVFLRDNFYLYTFASSTGTIARVSSRLDGAFYQSATVDFDRHLYVEIGGGSVSSWDIAGSPNYTGVRRTTTGCSTAVNAAAPGVAYDPVQRKIVIWPGGDTVYLLDTSTWSCTPVTFSGGPTAHAQGTYGRFAYSPTSNVFVTCNSVDANCYTLRLTSSGSVTPPPVPTVSIAANPTSISSGGAATLIWNSTNATSCSALGGWSGAKATSGSQSTGNLTANTTFTLTCTGSGGSANQSATVTVASSTSPPPTSTGSSVLLVKFGKTSTLNAFGLSGWSNVIKDDYTDYRDIGPGGTTIVVGDNYSYNYQGVTGTARNFASGEKIRVTWYNNSSNTTSFTPNISFMSSGRIGSNGWYPMTSVTVPSFGSAISEYTFSSATAGSYSLVNVNVNYSNNQVIIADKIELLPVGSSSPPSTSFDFSLSNGGNKSVSQGQSVSNSVAVTLVSETAQAISFSTTGLPAGATVSFLPNSCTPSCSTNMSIATSASTSAGSYPITVTAAGGGVTKTSAFTLTITTSTATPPPQPPSTSADADFQARCAAPGVVKCQGFNTMGSPGSADLVRYDVNASQANVLPRSDGQYRATVDTSIKKSGAGSLRFQLDAGYASANIAGQYLPQTNDGLGAGFGENSDMYIQFAVRFSPEMQSNLNVWDSAWKVAIFHQDQQSCASKELTTNHRGNTDNWLMMYKDCGGEAMYTALDGFTWHEPSPPYLFHQGNYSCEYPDIGNCWSYPTDKWITLYYKVHIGTYEQPNSTIEAWYSIDGQPYVKWINILANFRIYCNGGTVCPNEVFNNITLTPYMTGLSRAAPVNAYVWYDELIVSRQPIAAPGNSQTQTTTPAAPTGLAVK